MIFRESVQNNFFNPDEITGIPMPTYTSLYEDASTIYAESQNNWNKIMQAAYLEDLCIAESGSDNPRIIIEAGSGFLAKAKEFLSNLLKKVKGLFDKFIAWLSSIMSDDSSFVSKYKKDIIGGYSKIPDNASFKGYPFKQAKGKLDQTPSYTNPSTTDIGGVKVAKLKDLSFQYKFIDQNEQQLVKTVNDNKSKIYNKWRGALLGKADSEIEASEFSKEVFEYYHGSTSKESIDPKDFSGTELIDNIVNTNKIKKAANDSLRACTTGINDTIRVFDDIEKTLINMDKGDREKFSNGDYSKAVALISSASNILREFNTINATFNGYYLAALRDRNRQARSFAVKLVGYNRGKQESYSDYGNSSGSFLKHVELV